MKKPLKLLGLAICIVSIALVGNALATPAEEALDDLEESADLLAGSEGNEKDCRLYYVARALGLQEASLEAGEPINTLHLFLADADGRMIKNARVVTTVIDQQGNQQASRAIPFKGGYLVAIDHLAAGRYLVEAEIVTRGQLLTDQFRFSKA